MELPHLPVGTLVNVLAVLAGGGAGLLLRRGIPERFKRTLLTATGLATLALGAQMALKFDNALVLIGSLFLGGLVGEALDIDGWLARVAARFTVGTRLDASVADLQGQPVGTGLDLSEPAPASEPMPVSDPAQDHRCVSDASRRVPKAADGRTDTASRVPTNGLVTAFLIFCIGPMTILGALNEGLHGDPSLLLAKSFLDLITSFVLACSFGAGVLLSVVPLLVYQLALTLLGAGAQSVLTDDVTLQLTAVGGVLIIGLGLNLLEVAKLKVSNLLPALAVVVALELIW